MLAIDLQIAEGLRAIAGPIFAALCTEDKSGISLTVHASSNKDYAALKSNIIKQLHFIDSRRIAVKFHSSSNLLSAKSLETFVRRLALGRIVYDPTGALARARALVDASQNLRSSLDASVSGLYYAPLQRIFYVVLDRGRVSDGERIKLSTLTGIERVVLASVSRSFELAGAESPAVRVGFGVPATSLVPVDRKSILSWSQRILHSVKRYWKPVTVAALFGMGTAGAANAQDPAVSEANLKLRGSFGEIIDDYSWNVEGAFTAPLTETTGFAIEGGAGAIDGHEYYGGAGHLFVRDPESYLFGVFGAYAESPDFDLSATRVGGQVEFYLDQLTLTGTAGYQFSSGLGDKVFGSIDLKWYITNNFAVSGGAYIEEDHTLGRARIEWQPGFAALPGLAFHADGALGEDDYHSIMGGLTYYFGTPVDLKDRHRRQDPESALFGLFQSVQKEQQRLCSLYGCPNP